MKKITLLIFLFSCFTSFSQSHVVTFQVDMNNYVGSFSIPEVNGLFNNWCGNCAAMTDANTDGIWEIAVPITGDSTEYKFSFDNWAGQENLLPGSPCTKTTGPNTNRFIVITKDTVLAPVCWESCTTCSGAPTSANVTFQLDLSDYTGNYTDVNINGTFNNWCGGCATMTSPNNDSIFEITVVVPTDTIEFKYTLDAWTTEEMLTDGSPCTKTTVDPNGTFTNRIFVPTGDTTLPVVCWESCSSCSSIGISENNWIEDFTVFPNPSQGKFELKGTVSGSTNVSIKVHDTQGRLVLTSNSNDQEINETIDLEGLKNGIYILTLSNESNNYIEKLVLSN